MTRSYHRHKLLQELEAYEGYDIPESSRNISGMSSPTSYGGNASPAMSPYRIVPPISSADRDYVSLLHTVLTDQYNYALLEYL